MDELSDFEREQIFGSRLAGASVKKIVTLLVVSIATVSKVMLTYRKHGKTISAKRDRGRKSTLTERDIHTLRRIVSKNHRTTAAQVTAELDIHLDDPLSTKTVRRKLHKSSSHCSGKAAIAKPLTTGSNAEMCKLWGYNHETWTSDDRKRA
jgi:transposase